MLPNEMDYSLIQRTPDGSGMFLVTTPDSPDKGSYETEQDLKNWIIAAVGGAIIPKGDILSSNLPTPSDSNKGWQYYCTDINKWATSDGTQWIMTSNSIIVQTPDESDEGHALSNATVTEMYKEVRDACENLGVAVDDLDTRVDSLEIAAQSGYHYKGDCNYAELPTSGQQLGDMWYVKDRTMNYIWNGTIWRPDDDIGWNWVLQPDGNYKLGILKK